MEAEEYAVYKQNRVCVRCTRREVKTGTRCKICKEIHKANRSLTYWKRMANEQCYSCGANGWPNKACDTCREKRRQRDKEMSAR